MEVTTGRTIISFTVHSFGEETLVQTHVGEYRNLMVLLNEKFYLENFGECGGMGRCGTCVVAVINYPVELSDSGRNEAATLSKAGITNSKMRLACQILIDEELQGATISIDVCD
jgi:2Fe-2S ferredoxin